MNLRIRPFVNGPVGQFDDLPLYDPIGSVRRVDSLNKDYICVSLNLYTPHQWLEFDGENILAPEGSSGEPTPTEGDTLITEGGDTLITEGGDILITET